MKFTSTQQYIINLFHLSLFIVLIPLSSKFSFWIIDSFILPYNELIEKPFGFLIVFPVYAITLVPITVVLLGLTWFYLKFLISSGIIPRPLWGETI